MLVLPKQDTLQVDNKNWKTPKRRPASKESSNSDASSKFNRAVESILKIDKSGIDSPFMNSPIGSKEGSSKFDNKFL